MGRIMNNGQRRWIWAGVIISAGIILSALAGVYEVERVRDSAALLAAPVVLVVCSALLALDAKRAR